MKKITSSILIPSLLFYCFGCYSSVEITKDEFINHNDQKEKAFLLTKEKETYQLDELRYFVKTDTVYAFRGTKIAKETETHFSVQKPLIIPLENVNAYKLSEQNKTATWLVVGGIIVCALVLLAVSLPKEKPDLSAFDEWSNNNWHYPY